MMKIFVVVANDLLDNGAAETFLAVKRRVLAYTEASIQIPAGPGRVDVKGAGLGACKTQDQAQTLIDALAVELPTVAFHINHEVYENAKDVIWHTPR